MYRNTRLAKSIRLAFAVGATSASIFATSALAQEADAAVDETSKVERISVTGSRISRKGLDTIRPSISIDAELFDKRAFTNIADALTEVPVFGAGVDPNGDQNAFSVGQNFVDLFDLGTQRTLTLVNGRRFVSSNVPTVFGQDGGLQVDLNSIPVALMKDIEVVPLAGAAVYGSDAIAGVVNVILRDDYEGIEFSTQYGVTEEGDGKTRQFQVVAGTNFDNGKGNIAFSAEFNRQDGLLKTERPAFTDTNPDFLNFGNLDLDGDGIDDDVNGDGLPDTFQRVVDGGQRVQLLSGGGSVSPSNAFFLPSNGVGALADGNFYQFANTGNLESCTPGVTPAGSAFFAYGGTCGSDFFDSVEQLRSPLERFVVSSIAHYDFNDYVRFNQEFNFANSSATELVNQGGFQSFPFGGTSGPVTFQTSNPFLTDQARGILEGNGLTEFNINRFNNDLVGEGANKTENQTWRYYAGLTGDFEFQDRFFSWDVGVVFGSSDIETQTTGIIDGRFVNAIDAVRLSEESLQPVLDRLNGLAGGAGDRDGNGTIDVNDAVVEFVNAGGSGVSNAGLGSIVCQTNINNAAGDLQGTNQPASGGGITDGDLPFTDGCVPLNMFGEGVQSSESLSFINGGPQITSSDIEQRVITANLAGEIFELPAGPLGFAVGYEARQEKASFVPGLGSAVPLTRSSPFPPTTGELQTTEFYAETLIPLTSTDMDIPFVALAEIEGSVRRVKNEITDPNGVSSDDSVTAWEVGGRWSPIEEVVVRATYAEGIRTPSLVELFTPRVQAFISDPDPCDNREVNNGPNPAVRRANCVADGIADPDNFTSNIQNATIIGATQGNSSLVPEKSESYSYGVVYTPGWAEELTVSADYFNIKIADRIENFDFEALAESCYDSTDFPNVSACNQFTRDPDTGQVIDVTELFLNAASSNFEAINFRVLYSFDVATALNTFGWQQDSDLGDLDLNFNILRRITDKVQVVPTREADEDVGDFLDPSLEGTFDITYTKGDFRAFWRISYQDSPLFDETGNDFFLDDNDNIIESGEARFISNMSFSYSFGDHYTALLGIDNVFDREPDRYDLAAQYFGVTEELGRRYNLRFKAAF